MQVSRHRWRKLAGYRFKDATLLRDLLPVPGATLGLDTGHGDAVVWRADGWFQAIWPVADGTWAVLSLHEERGMPVLFRVRGTLRAAKRRAERARDLFIYNAQLALQSIRAARRSRSGERKGFPDG